MKKMFSVILTGIMLTVSTGSHSADAEQADAVSSEAQTTVYTIEDVRNLQDYLLADTTEGELSDKNYDLNDDGRWDAFDLCLMRREVIGEPDDDTNGNTLVVYFSRTGNTEKIAEYLIELTGAESYVIQAAVPYTDEDIEYNNSSCRANQEQNDKTVRPEIAGQLISLESYDTVFIGYPIWWGQEPRIIDTFLESYDLSKKTVIPFCTSASSGISTSEKNIAELVPIGEQLPGKRFSANAGKDDVKAWYDTLPLKKEESKLILSVNGHKLTASFADSTAAQELAGNLSTGPVSIELNEYGGFEKVGKLPWSLTRSDESIRTEAGDIMLYQGDQMTVFYAPNSWSYTRLGHIEDVSADELSAIFGQGNISVTLSIE